MRNRACTASSSRSSSQASTGRIPAHGKFGVVRVIGIILLLVWVWHVRHTFHVGEFAVGRARIPDGTTFRLDLPLIVDILIPGTHSIFVNIADDEIIYHARVTLPKDLNTV